MAPRRAHWAWWAVLPSLLLAFVAVVAGEWVVAWLRGEIGLSGERRYVPAHAADPSAAVTIDFGTVHAELMPDWLIAWANTDRRDAIEPHYQRLAAAVAADPNLAAIVAEMHELLPAPVENADRLLYLSWAWNDYLDAIHMPWRIDANVLLAGNETGFFYAKCYRVVTDLRVPVAAHSLRARIVERVDSTNVREGYLGHASQFQEGALVLLDRVRDFVIDDVWVMLDPAVESDLEPMARRFAPSIRRDATQALSTEQLEVLVDTARVRHSLVRVRAAVHARHACGNSLVIHDIPWRGFDADQREVFARFVHPRSESSCPGLLPREAVMLADASKRLQSEGDLRPALEAMIAWGARGTMVHELRHVADDEIVAGELRARLSCRPCVGMSHRALEELSAYVASFAHSRARFVSLFQACRLEPGGVHGRAMAALRELVPGLCADPPADLAEVMAALETDLFGRSDRIALPASYPTTLPLDG